MIQTDSLGRMTMRHFRIELITSQLAFVGARWYGSELQINSDKNRIRYFSYFWKVIAMIFFIRTKPDRLIA